MHSVVLDVTVLGDRGLCGLLFFGRGCGLGLGLSLRPGGSQETMPGVDFERAVEPAGTCQPAILRNPS